MNLARGQMLLEGLLCSVCEPENIRGVRLPRGFAGSASCLPCAPQRSGSSLPPLVCAAGPASPEWQPTHLAGMAAERQGLRRQPGHPRVALGPARAGPRVQRAVCVWGVFPHQTGGFPSSCLPGQVPGPRTQRRRGAGVSAFPCSLQRVSPGEVRIPGCWALALWCWHCPCPSSPGRSRGVAGDTPGCGDRRGGRKGRCCAS